MSDDEDFVTPPPKRIRPRSPLPGPSTAGRHLCDKCKSGFNSVKELTNHKKVCKELIPCNQCERVFNSRMGLKHHIKDKHSGNQARTSCPHCKSTFARPESLNTHIIIYHNAKEFKCKSCDFVTRSYAEYRKHKKKHERSHFMCALCDFGTRTNALMKNHNDEFHPPQQSNQHAIPIPKLTLGRVSSEEINGDFELEAVQQVESSVASGRGQSLGDTAIAVLVQGVNKVGSSAKEDRVVTCNQCILVDGLLDFDKVRVVSNNSGSKDERLTNAIGVRLTNKAASFYFIGDDEVQADRTKGALMLAQAFMAYWENRNGENGIRIPTEQWNLEYALRILQDNGTLLHFETEAEFKIREQRDFGFDLYPFNPAWISNEDKEFGHIYFAYCELSDVVYVYFGLNRNSEIILAGCHRIPNGDSTALGKFNRAIAITNPGAVVKVGILFYCGSEGIQQKLESAVILSGALNTGRPILFPGVTPGKPFKLLNEMLPLFGVNMDLLRAVIYTTYKLFKCRLAWELLTQPPHPINTTAVEDFFPQVKRFV